MPTKSEEISTVIQKQIRGVLQRRIAELQSLLHTYDANPAPNIAAVLLALHPLVAEAHRGKAAAAAKRNAAAVKRRAAK